MHFMQRPVAELINARYSCRTYRNEPIAADERSRLAEYLAAHTVGPFGSQARFALVAAAPGDHEALKRLGTYGFIKGAMGFLVGAVRRGPRDHEDYGYLVEQAILFATDLGLGTCWLGGTFTKGRFAARMGGLARDEIMPAVVSLGYAGDDGAERIREREAGSRRLPASSLFFDERFGEPLALESGDPFAAVLEGVRMAPSATNKQPWRVVRRGRDWHFYLQRSKGYGKGSVLFAVLRLADLQRVDLGIALCHFELAARELGLDGAWVLDEPDVGALGPGVEYAATWGMARRWAVLNTV
jgi:nitroreductase